MKISKITKLDSFYEILIFLGLIAFLASIGYGINQTDFSKNRRIDRYENVLNQMDEIEIESQILVNKDRSKLSYAKRLKLETDLDILNIKWQKLEKQAIDMKAEIIADID